MKPSPIRAWLLAARPKTLSGAVTPVLIGTALAVAHDTFALLPALFCLLFAAGMQVTANFVNDWYDFKKGTDRADRLGPERACAQGWISAPAMLRGVVTATIVSCLTGLVVVACTYHKLPYHGWELVALGALCVVFAMLYTTRLSYLGWGDLLVLVFFGLVPVGGTYYVQAYALPAEVWVAGTACGLVTDTLLVVNNYRDREQDAVSGKRTLIVRFGEPFGRYLYLGLGIGAALISPCTTWPFVYFHYRTWKKMCTIGSGKALNSVLGETSRNMLLFGLLLCAGILLGF